MGTMARTAVVAGTATAVSGNVARRQQARAQGAADQQAAEQQEAIYAQPAAPAAPAADDLTAQLERLSGLKTAGVISEAEFAAAKAKILGI